MTEDYRKEIWKKTKKKPVVGTTVNRDRQRPKPTGKIIVIDFMKKVNRSIRVQIPRPIRRLATIAISVGLIAAIVLLVFKPKTTQAIWWDDSWGYRKAITVTVPSNASDVTELETLLTVDTSTPITAGSMQSTCADIRFTNVNGTQLPYYLDSGCNGASTKVWVMADLVPKNTTTYTLYMYYGNPSAAAASDSVKFFRVRGLVGYWTMNETSWTGASGEVKDSSVNGNNGISVNGANTTASGKYSYGGSFDGSNDYVALPSINIGTSPVTFSLWAKGQSVPANREYGLITVFQSGKRWYFTLERSSWSTGNLIMYVGYPDQTPNSMYTPSGSWSITDTSWHHLVMTRNSSSMNLYIDGVLQATSTEANLTNFNVGDKPIYIGYPSEYYWGGSLDDVRIYNRALSASEVQQLYANPGGIASQPTTNSNPTTAFGTEEKAPGPVAYWSFDEGTGTNAQDSTTNNNDGTISGASWQSEDLCVSGKCLKFDGTDDYVNAGNPTSLKSLSSGAFTASAWIKKNTNTASQIILSKYNESPIEGWRLYTSDSNLRALIRCSTTDALSISDETIPLNSWTHVEMTYDNSSSRKVQMYINGKEVSYSTQTACAGTTNTDLNTNFYVGEDYDAAARPLNGFIDEPKIYNYARSAAQIKADYTARGTQKGVSLGQGDSLSNLSNGLVGYWKMDEASWAGAAGEVLDASGNGNNGTAVSGATTGAGKFGNGGSFDGVDDYAEVSDSSSLVFSNGITVGAWIKPDSNTVSGTTKQIVFKGNNGWEWGFNLTSGKVAFSPYNNNPDVIGVATGTTILSANTWYYVSGSYDGSVIRVYVNGILDGSTTISGTIWNSSHAVRIGSHNPTVSDRFFGGPIDETRIYNRALTPAEVSQLYNFAPGPRVYLNMNEGTGSTANDTSGNTSPGTLNSDATWGQGKFSKGAKLDGTGDDVSIPDFNY